MKRLHKIKVLFALALCLLLAGCGGGTKQEAADSAEEAAVHFLTNLQNGEFEQAKTYLDEENPLLTVFPTAEGDPAPELDAVYQQFREKMTGLTFRVGDEGAVGNSMVYITAAQYDFRSAINGAMLAGILRLGIPAAIQSCLITFSNLFVQRYVNGFGTQAMAGAGAGKKIDDYVSMITISLGQASTTYVSQCVGAGKYGRAYKGIRCVIGLDICIILALTIPIYIFAEPIGRLFTDDPGALGYAVMMVRTLMPLYVIQAFHQVLSNSVRGFGRSTAALVTTVAGLILCRQTYLAIAMALDHNIRLVFLSWPVGWAFSAVFAGVYYYFTIRRKNPA